MAAREDDVVKINNIIDNWIPEPITDEEITMLMNALDPKNKKGREVLETVIREREEKFRERDKYKIIPTIINYSKKPIDLQKGYGTFVLRSSTLEELNRNAETKEITNGTNTLFMKIAEAPQEVKIVKSFLVHKSFKELMKVFSEAEKLGLPRIFTASIIYHQFLQKIVVDYNEIINKNVLEKDNSFVKLYVSDDDSFGVFQIPDLKSRIKYDNHILKGIYEKSLNEVQSRAAISEEINIDSKEITKYFRTIFANTINEFNESKRPRHDFNSFYYYLLGMNNSGIEEETLFCFSDEEIEETFYEQNHPMFVTVNKDTILKIKEYIRSADNKEATKHKGTTTAAFFSAIYGPLLKPDTIEELLKNVYEHYFLKQYSMTKESLSDNLFVLSSLEEEFSEILKDFSDSFNFDFEKLKNLGTIYGPNYPLEVIMEEVFRPLIYSPFQKKNFAEFELHKIEVMTTFYYDQVMSFLKIFETFLENRE